MGLCKLLILLALSSFLVSGCSKSHVNYSANPQTYNPVKASKQTASLPSGQGGYVKTGKPYQVAGQWYYPLASSAGYNQIGTASWYGKKFHGKKTANGERYNMHALSAAHKTLPMPSMVKVTNLENGRSIIVRVNDRGPFVKSRIIDLSYAAAKALAYDQQGTARVRVQVLDASSNQKQQASTPVAASPVVKASSSASSAAQAGIYVQLGAFSSQHNAQSLQQDLMDQFPNVHLQHISQSNLYRVRIGPFQSPPETENIILSLEQQGYHNAIVIIE
ncbi:MAG: septal ring lytic transglycosylase RlpA family protein [Mariprofundaceae bacterium]